MQLMQNAVDWSLADLDLLSIRSRGVSTRVLKPLTDSERSVWELINYAVALVVLVGIGVIWRTRQRTQPVMKLTTATTTSHE
jgi:hypothetical protein